MVSKSVVRARLRKGKDDDLRAAVENLISQGHDEADLVRAGLRQLLGLGSPGPVADAFTAVKERPAAPTAVKAQQRNIFKAAAPPVIEKAQEPAREDDSNADADFDRLLGI